MFKHDFNLENYITNVPVPKYRIALNDASGFDEFIYTMLSDSLSNSVKLIIETLNEF